MPETGDVWTMRPKLRHDVVFLETPAGAYLRGADAAFVLKGRSAYRWLTTLSPYLTGEHSLEELCAGLDNGQRQTVSALVRALVARGFVKDSAARTAIPAPLARCFHSQIDFIDHFADDATGRFLRFHRSRVVLGGTGPTLLAAAVGLVRNGCGSVEVRPEDDPEPYRRALRAEVDKLRGEQVSVSARVAHSPIETTDADAVVYCAEPAQLPRVLELARRCHAGGPLLVPVVQDGRQAVLGPSSRVGGAPCWLCAQLRLTANADPAVAAESWRHLALGSIDAVDGGRVSADAVAAGMVGNAAAFEVFRSLTGALPPETDSSVVVLDLSTLESARERVLRHPQCPLCRDTPVVDTASVPDPLTDEDAYQRCEVLVSAHAGVFTRFVDDPLEQAPLKTARLRMPPVTDGDSVREITAFDIHTVLRARLAAYRVAIRDYVSRLAAPEGGVLASANELIEAGRVPVPWHQVVTASGAIPYAPERRLTWLPGRVLGSEETVWVPAALALPMSAANREGYAERTIAGAVAAPTSAAVASDGLAGALAYEALQALMRGRAMLAPVAEADLIDDEDAALVIKAAHRFGYRPRVFHVTAAPVPVVLAVSDLPDGRRPLWTTAAAFSTRQARLDALRDLVGLLQVQHFEGTVPDTGLPLLVDFDPRTAPVADAAAVPMALAAESTVAEIVSALSARGLAAVQVDITTSDIRSVAAMHAGTVLLWRREAAAH